MPKLNLNREEMPKQDPKARGKNFSEVALGYEAEAQEMEITFEGTTMFATGKVLAFGFSPTLNAEVVISTDEGKPNVEVKRFQLGSVPLSLVGLSRAKIAAIVNDAIQSRGLELPVDIENIRIEDARLIVTYK